MADAPSRLPRPPYLRTVHTWRCTNGHETVIDDQGWPQTPGLGAKIAKAFALHAHDTCGACGARSTYSHTEHEAPDLLASSAAWPRPTAPVPAFGIVPNPHRFAEAAYAFPMTKGGFAEFLRFAGRKKTTA